MMTKYDERRQITTVVKTVCVAFAMLAASVQQVTAQTKESIEALRTETSRNLRENILPFWMEKVKDPAGGFYGVVLNDGTPIAGADKGAVLNARILWTFSQAYRLYALEPYRQMANRAADYYVSHFVDPVYGGVYWSLNGDGGIKNPIKQTYAAAFGIYGLAEHFRATGCKKSLQTAIAIYKTLEERVHDKAGLGYIESFQRDYSRSQIKGVDGQESASKTMNTHIHVLEAYTTLYQVWPNETLKANLKELLQILGTKLYSPKRSHLIMFCDDDWTPVGGEEDSYGHDIETAWLMCEAAAVVGDQELELKVKAQALKMTETALKEGLNAEGVMRYEKVNGVYSKRMAWWPQCETIIGAVNAWQLTGNKMFFEAARRNWEYVKTHFVDETHGGWYKGVTEDGKPAREPKVSEWNCPYHNSRMAFELTRRLEPATVHTEVMAWSNITGVRLEGELIDFESTLRVGTPGGKMEKSGREKQKNIKYLREGKSQTTVTPMHGAEFVQKVTDIDMSTVRLNWKAEAKENLSEGAYFCMSFGPKYYATAKIHVSGKKVTVIAPERRITLLFEKAVPMTVRQEDGCKVLYVTLLPFLKKGQVEELSAQLTVDGVRHQEMAEISIDTTKPGRAFTGFGGNFRIQNIQKDPTVIDYCLKNMRIAFGRVEMPWMLWDQAGAEHEHVKRSAEMARRLKQMGMPVIVSCWFPPMWAGIQTTRSDGTERAFALKSSEKERIFASLADYLVFLKKDYGVEADYFSFNESDLGINVVFTPEEHRDFIKEFGQYLAERDLKTLMLLGDNSDATTFDFILPALRDPSARRYIGAISFHSWRGCDDKTLQKWAEAARQINLPLIVGEGSTDAAAHQYPTIFNETTFALYEINLYVRLCAIAKPLSILQWQLTSDYSILWGDGIYRSEGPLRPTQRFFNLKQLSMTPADAFVVPSDCNKENINVASYVKKSTGESAVHIVNNGAACQARISGLPIGTTRAIVHVTNSRQHAEAQLLEVADGELTVSLPAESFVTILSE